MQHADNWPLGHGPNAQRREFRWPQLLTADGKGIAYGGDYNPDQWPESVWDDDIRLMKKAHVNVVALGIFSWDKLQPTEYEWDFTWLDTIIDKLGSNGISVDLASMTATAPMWLYEKYPEVLPVEANGDVINAGSRQSWSAESPIFKRFALEVCKRLAERYKDNPYVTAWHIGNEYGWNQRHDYSKNSEDAFRRWCERKYGTIDALNEAWGTAFWSQHLNSFSEVLVPRHMGADSMVNPAQQLDYERFGSDSIKEFYKAERDMIESICPDKPITTNFMVSTDQCVMDYADWSDEVDFVSNDHYFTAGRTHVDELACSDSLVSGFANGRPWYLMEHSTSAVQWKPLNARKRHGEMTRDALEHVALGADAICFFQWRQSRSGAETFHSAMVPHAGEDSKLFREVCELGATLEALSKAGVQGSEVMAGDTAILFDADCEWMTRCETLPSMQLNHFHAVRDWYYAFLDAGARADVVPLRGDWSAYRTIVMPTMVNISEQAARRVREFVCAGGRVIIDYATGLMDENFHAALGGYPGMLRDIAGVRSEEVVILGEADGEPDALQLDSGATVRLWANDVTSVGEGAQVLARYVGPEAQDMELDDVPAIVQHPFGEGVSWYIGCDLSVEAKAKFLCEHVTGQPQEAPSIIHTVRGDEHATYHFYLARDKEAHTITFEGEPVVAFRARTDANSAQLERSGVLVTKIARK